MTAQDHESNTSSSGMPLTAVVAEYLRQQGWDDEIEVDEDARTSSLDTRVRSNGQSYRLFIDTNESRCDISVYMYSPFSIPAARMTEAARLFNLINFKLRLGRLGCEDDGNANPVQYCAVQDYEGSVCEPCQIDMMVDAALWVLTTYERPLAAVAFTEQTALDAWKSHRQQIEQGADFEVPDPAIDG